MQEPLDIVKLIEKNPITRFSSKYQSKLIEKIKANFTQSQQQLFLGNFYCYLKCHPTNDYVIDLNTVWRWLGFLRKDPVKRLLDKHFTRGIDYKVELRDNKEQILLNVNTYKSLCVKSGTKRGDEVYDYFSQLERTLRELVDEESKELRWQLEQAEHCDEKQNIIDPTKYLYVFKSKELDLFHISIFDTVWNGELILKVGCRNAQVIQDIVHNFLEKYRSKHDIEWFKTSYENVKKAIDFTKLLLDSDIDFEEDNIVTKTRDFLARIKICDD